MIFWCDSQGAIYLWVSVQPIAVNFLQNDGAEHFFMILLDSSLIISKRDCSEFQSWNLGLFSPWPNFPLSSSPSGIPMAVVEADPAQMWRSVRLVLNILGLWNWGHGKSVNSSGYGAVGFFIQDPQKIANQNHRNKKTIWDPVCNLCTSPTIRPWEDFLDQRRCGNLRLCVASGGYGSKNWSMESWQHDSSYLDTWCLASVTFCL